jgi:hypothetical protein
VGNEPFRRGAPGRPHGGRPALKQMVDAYHEIGGGSSWRRRKSPAKRRSATASSIPDQGPHHRRSVWVRAAAGEAPTLLRDRTLYIAAGNFHRIGAARAGVTRSSSPTPWRGCSGRVPLPCGDHHLRPL